MITATLSAIARAFIVYTVKIEALSDLFYVGCCPLDALARLPDAKANSQWRAIVKPDTQLSIQIAACLTDEASARALQSALGDGAWCNRHGTHVTTNNRVQCVKTGIIYYSAAAAAAAIGASRSAMSQHLNGKLDAIKGFTFKRE